MRAVPVMSFRNEKCAPSGGYLLSFPRVDRIFYLLDIFQLWRWMLVLKNGSHNTCLKRDHANKVVTSIALSTLLRFDFRVQFAFTSSSLLLKRVREWSQSEIEANLNVESV